MVAYMTLETIEELKGKENHIDWAARCR